MKYITALIVLSAVMAAAGYALSAFAGQNQMTAPAERQSVVLATSLGNITVELFPDKAPITVKNFLSYTEAGFYDGTVFHRVIPSFMIQGGGFTADMQQKATNPPIKNEAANGLSNQRGTIAMARTSVVDSATSQFFINLKDNTFLDHMVRDFGYTVFGRVVDGMDVVDRIAAVPTGTKGAFRDVPMDTILIHSAKRSPAADKK